MELLCTRASDIEPRPWTDLLLELERLADWPVLHDALLRVYPGSHPSYHCQIGWRFLVSRPMDVRLSCLAIKRGFTSPDQIRSRKVMARLQRELGLELSW